MPDVELVPVLVAAVAVFALSAVYYGVLGDRLAAVSDASGAAGQPPPWAIAAELARCLVVATVVAGLASQGDVDGCAGGLLLGLALWIGFPLVLWAGAMLHERTPWRPAAIHAGDWLAKLLVVAVIVSAWG